MHKMSYNNTICYNNKLSKINIWINNLISIKIIWHLHNHDLDDLNQLLFSGRRWIFFYLTYSMAWLTLLRWMWWDKEVYIMNLVLLPSAAEADKAELKKQKKSPRLESGECL